MNSKTFHSDTALFLSLSAKKLRNEILNRFNSEAQKTSLSERLTVKESFGQIEKQHGVVQVLIISASAQAFLRSRKVRDVHGV